jgi:4-diphosphocytidyl-2-C-methyl-D-erythritol kinase
MISLLKKSYAKINLSLSVGQISKDNGLHPINSTFQEISLYDELQITAVKKKQYPCKIKSTGIPVPVDSGNILRKIVTQLEQDLTYSYIIELKKNIPLGSGMGGASSNAALFLKAINTIEKKHWDYETLTKIGKQFGSDIPFFLKGGLQEVSGFGDILKKIPYTSPRFFTLIYPNIECSTKEIYAHFDSMIKTDKETIKSYSNNLLPIVLNYYPKMLSIYSQLKESASYPVNLTGSGSTFFIETPTLIENTTLYQKLLTIYPDFYIKPVEALYNEHPMAYSTHDIKSTKTV